MQIAILVVLGLITVLLASLSWILTSRTPSTRATPTSADLVTSLMSMMREISRDSLRETRDLVVTLVQGREQPPPTGPQETPLTEIERQSTYDYDSTPLSPGIEGVLEREAQERAEQARLEASLRERSALQERMREIERLESEARELRESLEQSSPGPWHASQVDHDLT